MTCAAAWRSETLIARLLMCTHRHSIMALPYNARQLELSKQELHSACTPIDSCIQQCNISDGDAQGRLSRRICTWWYK